MRSGEYLRALEEALQGYDEEMAKELMASLNEHFEQGLSAGKSEEELCAELGAVEDLISELDAAPEAKKAQEASARTVSVGGTEKDPSGAVHEKTEAPSGDGLEAEAHTETALAKRVRADGYPVSRIYAELGFADVKLSRTDEAVPYIRLQRGSDEPENVRLEEHFDGDTYTVKLVRNERAQSREKRSVLGQIFDGLASGGLSVGLGVRLALELYIPADIRELCVKQSSGDISGDALNTSVIKLSSGSGDIDLKNVCAEHLETRSASGDVTLESIFGATIAAHSTSGDVDIEDAKAVNLTVHSTSGDLALRSCVADEQLGIDTTSGDIHLDDVQAHRLKLNTISGDVTVCVQCAEAALGSTSGELEATFLEDVDAKLNSVSGDVDVHLQNDERGFCARTQTVSGDVYARYGTVRGHYGKKSSISAGKETSRLEIHTVSGDIRIGV